MNQTIDLRHLSMSEAYDETQTNENIGHGAVLLVQDGIAILDRAWPIMFSGTSEVFHMLAPETNWSDIELDQRDHEHRRAIESAVLAAQQLLKVQA